MYQPELDISPKISTEESSYDKSLIGVLRWIVKMGRINICLEVSMMSSHLALPREGHLEQAFQIFLYLKKYHNAELVYDPSDPVVNKHEFEQRDWAASIFGHLQGVEVMPPNMLEPRGMGFVMRANVGGNLAAVTVTRRSRTGFLEESKISSHMKTMMKPAGLSQRLEIPLMQPVDC